MKYAATILAVAGTTAAFIQMRGHARMAGGIMFGANLLVIGLSALDYLS